MDCDVAREALSARVDGEREPVPAHRVDEHVAGCAPCRDWQSALLDQTHLLRRLAGRSLVAAVPAPKEPAHRGRPRISWLRAALAVVGAVQLAVAVAQGIGLNLGMAHQHGAAAGHLMNESTAWSAALGVVMAATAFRPRLASGVAAVLVAYSAVLAVFVITDALAGAVTATMTVALTNDADDAAPFVSTQGVVRSMAISRRRVATFIADAVTSATFNRQVVALS